MCWPIMHIVYTMNNIIHGIEACQYAGMNCVKVSQTLNSKLMPNSSSAGVT